MAYLCVDKDGTELIFSQLPQKVKCHWMVGITGDCIELPHGSIAKLIGRELTWSDEPVNLE